MPFRSITRTQFDYLVRLHHLWLKNPTSLDGRQADFRFCDFSGWQLKNLDLSYALMDHCNLNEATIEFVSFVGASLKGVLLNGTMFIGDENHFAKADFIGAETHTIKVKNSICKELPEWIRECESTTYTNCDLSPLSLEQSKSRYLELVDSRLGKNSVLWSTVRSSKFKNCQMGLQRVNACNASEIKIHKGQIGPLEILDSTPKVLRISECAPETLKIYNSSFSTLDLKCVEIANIRMEASNFDQWVFSSSKFTRATIEDSRVKQVYICDSIFSGMVMLRCQLEGATFTGCHFGDCEFRGMNFRRSSFASSKILNCTFKSCDLSECNLSAIDFQTVTMTDVVLDGARITNKQYNDALNNPRLKTLIKDYLFNGKSHLSRSSHRLSRKPVSFGLKRPPKVSLGTLTYVRPQPEVKPTMKWDFI